MPPGTAEGTPLGPQDFEDETILAVLISRLRERNRKAPARELSIAIQHAQTAWLWLRVLRAGGLP